ncbi:MAG: GLUG motif-containing protein [Candidatus ainarchaeum sp.]|nr:GLUG motif-containing protein [Candidatus ainarchaeum sp.]
MISKNNFKLNKSKSWAQGTIEYLVLLAVVLIVALLGVFLINGLGNGEAINVTGDKLLSTSSGVSVVDAVVDEDGNGLVSLSNRTGQGITVRGIGSTEYTYFLPSGESVVFSATELDDLGCKCNGSETSRFCVVPVTYEDSKGIPKTESIKIEMSCVDSNLIDFSNAVSPGAFSTSGGGFTGNGTSGVNPNSVGVPVVVLLSPVNGFDVNESVISKTIDFNFSVSSSVDANCSLLINNVDVNSLTDLNSGNHILSYTFSIDGNYSWKVNCTNTSGSSIVSNLYLTMDNNYQEIIDCQGLQDMNKHLDGNYRLMNNIDCSSILNFTPVGRNGAVPFIGNLNGQNYTISHLNINLPEQDSIGLFGFTKGSEIKNVGLIDANIIGRLDVGGLIGYAHLYTSVSNSFSTGELTAIDDVGGLIGFNYSSYVSNSFSTSEVTGIIGVGGLIGNNTSYSDVSNSFSTGKVTGTDKYIGGLIGLNSVSYVSNSFSTGEVIGNNNIGGLIGENIGSSYEFLFWSYYDLNTSNQSDTGKGEGKTTLELTNVPIESEDVYVGWDFDTIWSHDLNGQYPTLKWQTE